MIPGPRVMAAPRGTGWNGGIIQHNTGSYLFIHSLSVSLRSRKATLDVDPRCQSTPASSSRVNIMTSICARAKLKFGNVRRNIDRYCFIKFVRKLPINQWCFGRVENCESNGCVKVVCLFRFCDYFLINYYYLVWDSIYICSLENDMPNVYNMWNIFIEWVVRILLKFTWTHTVKTIIVARPV